MNSPSFDRSAHDAACPCNLCIGFDIAFAKQEGKLRAEHWQPGGLEGFLLRARSLKLNWDFEPGHCLLCGGTTINSWILNQHYEIHRYNTAELGGKFYTSLLLHKQGPMIAVYRHYLQKSGPFKSGDARALLIKWASNLMDLNPTYAFGLAARELPEWIEVRLGYHQLVEETREQRIAKQSDGERREGSNLGTSSEINARPVQGPPAVARNFNSVLATSTG